MKNEIKLFVEKFFLKLGARVIHEGESLIIKNVSESFEKFYGKKSPYEFVFNGKDKTPEKELIEKGSYLLKTISNFLDGQGKTTLLKINFNVDPEKELTKRIKLTNCRIEKLSPKKKNNFFFRFTFHTSFQYLNEKEKIINDIYVYNGKVVNGNLSSYEVIEGEKSEVLIPDIAGPYELAREQVKELIKPKVISVSSELSIKLHKEINRVEKHFSNEMQESKDNLGKKLKDSQELDDGITKKNKEIEKDKIRAIEIERQKYGLNLNTKLFNTTLIYYPVATYDCFLGNEVGKRIVEISFDPLLKKLNSLFCENCNEELMEIFFCSSGHLSCKKCFSVCNSCSRKHCKKCLTITCEGCKKNICKKCAQRCFNCSKMFCRDHTTLDKISHRHYCSNCLRICERCSAKREPSTFRKSPKTNAEVCEECYRKEMSEKTIKGIFKR